MANDAPIGVFDSGIGGLTVFRELINLMPGENLIYFGDTARAPYGSRPAAEILTFMHQILHFFAAQQVKMVVVACNSMTSLGIDIIQRQYPFMAVGVNTAVRSALRATRNKSIGVIATQATISSGKHGNAVISHDPTAKIYPQACPKFVPLIEKEFIEGALIEDAALEYLVPLKEEGIDTLILGCTHYPFISPLIRRILGADVTLVDPAHDTAEDARAMLVQQGQLAEGTKGTRRLCFSADLDRAERIAKHFIGNEPMEFELVDLQDYYTG